MKAATWAAVCAMLASISWLKYSRWDKHYGIDELRWHEWLVIAVGGLAFLAVLVLGLMGQP